MGDRTTRPIEQIKTGDHVLATNPETGNTGPRRVDATIYTPDDRNFTDITLDQTNGGGTLTTTDHHPFWTDNNKQWKNAADLTPQDTLRTSDGDTAQVSKVHHWKNLQPAHDLTVNDLHTYYVLAGATPVLVHNSNCVRGPGGRFQPNPSLVADARYARVTLRSSIKKAVQDAAPRDANGDFIDPNTGQSIPSAGPFHYGHKPGFEYWRSRDAAQVNGWTREQFIDFENNPSHYQIEDPYNNLSHQYEQP